MAGSSNGKVGDFDPPDAQFDSGTGFQFHGYNTNAPVSSTERRNLEDSERRRLVVNEERVPANQLQKPNRACEVNGQ